jgi:hypothetical protein
MDLLLAGLPPEADAAPGPLSSYPTLKSGRQALAEIAACRLADQGSA